MRTPVHEWLARRRLRALTRAVYTSAVEEDPVDADDPGRKARLAPSGASTCAVIVTIIAVSLCALWRLGPSGTPAPGGPAQSSGAAQSAGAPDEDGRSNAAQGAAPAPDGTRPSGARAAGARSGRGSQAAGASQAVVYVTGRVASPGLLTMPAGSRVGEAIEAAGGPVEGADLESLNLARVIADGEHIVVPAQGAAPAPPGAGGPEGAKCVNLNAASEQELQELDGVGPAMASRIAQYRAAHGTITSVDELDDVPGIGPALLEKIRSGACP